jgi:hypothetical protein
LLLRSLTSRQAFCVLGGFLIFFASVYLSKCAGRDMYSLQTDTSVSKPSQTNGNMNLVFLSKKRAIICLLHMTLDASKVYTMHAMSRSVSHIRRSIISVRAHTCAFPCFLYAILQSIMLPRMHFRPPRKKLCVACLLRNSES